LGDRLGRRRGDDRRRHGLRLEQRSNFTQPLIAAFGWNATQTSLVFGLAIFMIGIGAVVGGRWQDRVGPRNVTVIGIVLWGVGNLLAAVGPCTTWWFDLTFRRERSHAASCCVPRAMPGALVGGDSALLRMTRAALTSASSSWPHATQWNRVPFRLSFAT
jgi:MFS family permease